MHFTFLRLLPFIFYMQQWHKARLQGLLRREGKAAILFFLPHHRFSPSESFMNVPLQGGQHITQATLCPPQHPPPTLLSCWVEPHSPLPTVRVGGGAAEAACEA